MLVPHQADLIGMHEVIAMRKIDLVVLCLHPYNLVYELVTPAV
jgi:hypothetical protein